MEKDSYISKKNKMKSLLLLIMLIVISTAFIVSLSIWRGSKRNIRKLRQTYGTTFTMAPDFDAEGVKPLVDADIDKVMSIQGVVDVCKEIKTVLFIDKLELSPGLYTESIEMAEEYPDYISEDDIYLPELSIKVNTLQGCNKSELSNYFRTNAFELIEGRHITEYDHNQVLISDVMAEKNSLSLGDIIYAESNGYLTLGDPSIVYKNYDLEIVGIYHVNVNQVVSNYTPEDEIAENFIFISSSTALENVRAGNKRAGVGEPSYRKATFFVSDPKMMDAVMEKVSKLDIDFTYMKIKADDSAFQSALGPLQSISKITMFMMVFVIVVSVILLSLILRMWIGTRSKEMGILLSMGNSRKQIAGQFVLEGLLILCASLVISFGISTGVCEKVGNRMLSGVNAQNERVEKIKEKALENPDEMLATVEGQKKYMEQMEMKPEVNVSKAIDCKVTVNSVVISGAILTIALILTTVISARKILKMKPKEILSIL